MFSSSSSPASSCRSPGASRPHPPTPLSLARPVALPKRVAQGVEPEEPERGGLGAEPSALLPPLSAPAFSATGHGNEQAGAGRAGRGGRGGGGLREKGQARSPIPCRRGASWRRASAGRVGIVLGRVVSMGPKMRADLVKIADRPQISSPNEKWKYAVVTAWCGRTSDLRRHRWMRGVEGGDRQVVGAGGEPVESGPALPMAAVSAGGMLAGARRGIDHGPRKAKARGG